MSLRRILVKCLSVASLTVGSLLSALPSAAQSIPPELMAQFNSLSPAQQVQLAKQYGIQLPKMGSSAGIESTNLAEPGVPLAGPQPQQSSLESYQQMLLEQEELTASVQKRYGQDIFDVEVSTFAPTDNAPIPSNYRLGVGDNLTIQLFGKENEELNLQIGRSGEIALPRLGSLTLSGLTFEDARDLIKTRISQQLIGVDAVISMGRLRAINVFMAGEVAAPGMYSVSALTTVTQALFQAGGITEIGSLRTIEVRRDREVIATFDAYNLLLRGDAAGDIRLASGDVIYVPPFKGEVEITGAVKRPMIYELLGDESVADVIEMAGAFTSDAFVATTLLVSRQNNAALGFARTIDLTSEIDLAIPVKSGDVLTVPEAGSLVAGSVSLQGAVNRPGSYGWRPDLRLSELIGDLRRDLALDADLNLGMIVRQQNELLDIEVLEFQPSQVAAQPGSESDPVLHEFDEILIFSLVTSDLNEAAGVDSFAALQEELEVTDSELQIEEVDEEDPTSRVELLKPVIAKLRSQAKNEKPVQLVSISGGVRAPGTYPLVKGATAQSLIDAAGGLKDSAFLEAAELRRIVKLNDGEVSPLYVEINLSSGQIGSMTPLQSRDHITIRDIPNWSPDDEIEVLGEVRFPGKYRIGKDETLSNVIRRAGGLTSEAFPEGAVFTRRSVAETETKRAAELSREIQNNFASRLLTEETTTQSVAEVSQILSVLNNNQSQGRLLINLPNALNGDENADLAVTRGDVLRVPRQSNTVAVVGEVKRAGTHTYQEYLSMEDYVDLSAGYSNRADKKSVYIVKVNGAVQSIDSNLWTFRSQTLIVEPGDTIVVPINTQYKESLASWREITQIVYQSVVSIAAVARL
jgi:polysaccharide export outer membrane protein